MNLAINPAVYTPMDDVLLPDGFQAAASAALTADEALDEVIVTENYEAPRAPVDPSSVVLMQTLTGAPESSETKVAPVGELVDKIEDGGARILSGSTTDALLIEVDGQVYVVIGHYAELLVDRALQVNGFFATYMTTYGLARGGVIDHEDEAEIVLDPDGKAPSEEA